MKVKNAGFKNKNIKHLCSGGGAAIPLFKVFMPKSVMKPLKEVLFSGYIGEGPRVEEFERKLAPWFGSENILTLNNGTSAIQLALRLANVGYGDEVISTPMTCVATNEPILTIGAKIVWADIDPHTGNIDPEDAAKKITKKTKAIIAVHWGGYPCELESLNNLAAAQGIKLIEDACHAFGATYQNKPIGSLSDFTCFSFQAIKEITTIDGGALVCKSLKDYKRGKLLRWYGIDRTTNRKDFRCEEDIAESGYKFHMNDVAAAIGIEQLKYVGVNLRKNQVNATRYNQAFSTLTNIAPLNYKNDRMSSYWLYTLRVKNPSAFIEWMKKARIVTSQVHARNDLHSIFKDFRADLPGVDEFMSRQTSIPVGWWLTPKEISYIIGRITKY
ncbi:MAG: DegT/DnrJ/EryC1/StrS family aminotransferase [Candidatus Omnitrophica bacterium]|nr:DegT/DnrJ/EryC1/StrS family aminotransferase [Candidatus Omnitrophota bacterium]